MLKLRKVSKYFENDSLQNFLLVSLTLLTAQQQILALFYNLVALFLA